MEVKIVIPSHKRAQTIKAHKIISNAIVCIPKSQEEEYLKHNPDINLVCHPDSIVGLGAKRNWILHKYKNVFMIDDDCVGMVRLHIVKGEDYKIDPDTAYDLVQYTGNIASLSKASLFGYHHVFNPAAYDGLKPLRMKGYVMGGSIGVLEGGNLYFSTEIVGGNDYYISALNAFLNRRAFQDWRFCFVCPKTGKNKGGLGSKRSEESERKDHEYLVEKFGDAFLIKGEKMGLGRNKMQYGKVLKLPF